MNDDEQDTAASDRDAPIAVLVLRMPALLPYHTMTVRCARPVGLKLLAHVVAASLHDIVVVGQRDPRVEEPDESDLFDLGCRARVVSVDLSASQMVVVGVSRARIAAVVSSEPCFLASVLDVPEPEASPRAAAIAQQILAVCERAAAAGDITPALLETIRRATPGARADMVAEFAEVRGQRWLQAVDVEQRCVLALEAVQAAFPAASPAAPTHGITLLAQTLTMQEHVQRRVSEDVEAAARALHRVLDGRAQDHFDELVHLLIDAEDRGAEATIPPACWSLLADAADALEQLALAMYLAGKAAGWPRQQWADVLAAMVVFVDRAPSTWFVGEEAITALLQRVRDRVATHLDRSLLSSASRAELAAAIAAVDGGAAAVFAANDDDVDVMSDLCELLADLEIESDELRACAWSVVNVVARRSRS